MHYMESFIEVPPILIEQNADPVLLNFKRQLLGLAFDEQTLAINSRYTHHCRNKKRIIFRDDILNRQNYTDFGEISDL